VKTPSENYEQHTHIGGFFPTSPFTANETLKLKFQATNSRKFYKESFSMDSAKYKKESKKSTPKT
jgi:hypothetical protein